MNWRKESDMKWVSRSKPWSYHKGIECRVKKFGLYPNHKVKPLKEFKVWKRLEVCSQGPVGRQYEALFIQNLIPEWPFNSVLWFKELVCLVMINAFICELHVYSLIHLFFNRYIILVTCVLVVSKINHFISNVWKGVFP